jgi:integrase
MNNEPYLKDITEISINGLISTQHYSLPYSIIKKHIEAQIYLPLNQTDLEILNQKSTTRAFEIVKEYTSKNSELAGVGDLIYWQAWLSAIGFTFLEPITQKEIITFIVEHAQGLDADVDQLLVDQHYKQKLGPHKLSTIKRRIATLSSFLDGVQWDNPCRNKEVKQLCAKLAKKHGTSKPHGKAITKDILDDMLDFNEHKLIDIRDKALLLFAWASGGRRRSEVTQADMKDLVKTPQGDYIYTIPKSKTDQIGQGHSVPVKGRAAYALTKWLEASYITTGSIFKAIKKNGNLGEALSPIDVNRIVKRRLKNAGYNEKEYGAHSLRSGFVTQAGRMGKHLGDIMSLTTHKSVATVMRYYQAGSIINNSAANLAD